jgi:hypothetical protein
VRHMAGDPPQELDYAPPRKQRSFHPWRLIAAVILPTIGMAAMLTASQSSTRKWSTGSLWVGPTVFGVALICGALLFLRSGLPRVTVVLYVVVQTAWCIYFGVYFNCAVFGKCP